MPAWAGEGCTHGRRSTFSTDTESEGQEWPCTPVPILCNSGLIWRIRPDPHVEESTPSTRQLGQIISRIISYRFNGRQITSGRPMKRSYTEG